MAISRFSRVRTGDGQAWLDRSREPRPGAELCQPAMALDTSRPRPKRAVGALFGAGRIVKSVPLKEVGHQGSAHQVD